jgi:hypothetical protein
MYNPNGLGNLAGLAGSYAGQLSVGQAALYRQASIIAADAQTVLAGLTSTSPKADLEEMDAARALANSQIANLVQEFGRVDEPRAARISFYLSALQPPGNTLTIDPISGQFTGSSSLIRFANAAAYYDKSWVTTDSDAAQIAGFNLLLAYVQDFANAWNAYNVSGATAPFDPDKLSLRLERANVMVPSVGQANDDFRMAMASVDFSESEQRSVANRFTSLDPQGLLYNGGKGALPLPLASQTPGDLTDWIDSLTTDGLSTLSGSGRYGLEFVTNQADSIFWVVAPVAIISVAGPIPTLPHPILAQYLENERVVWSMNNLLTQLDGLADLAIPLSIT